MAGIVVEADGVVVDADGVVVDADGIVSIADAEVPIADAGGLQGLEQLDGYLAQLRLARGVLVIFDRRKPGRAVAPRFEDTTTPSGRVVRLMRA